MVVALGSGWSTYWDAVAPAVRAEQDLMRSALSAGVPVFGICFGAQQLSVTLGGSVSRAPVAEIGWYEISPVREGRRRAPSVLFEDRWMQWHYDAFSVPSGASVLAESGAGPQVFVHGRSVGVQFHPEATESIVVGWSDGEGTDELRAAGLDRASLVDETRRRMTSAARRCDTLVQWVLGVAGFAASTDV